MVPKPHPTSLHNTILNLLIGDEDATTKALKHRDQLLNSQVRGLRSQRAGLSDPYEGRTELLKVGEQYRKNPTEKKIDSTILILLEKRSEKRFKQYLYITCFPRKTSFRITLLLYQIRHCEFLFKKLNIHL